MKRLMVLLLMICLLPAPSVTAQGCGKDPLNPCGPLPWSVPGGRSIPSPTPYTPMPTSAITVTPTPSETPVAVNTAVPTPQVGATIDPAILQTPARQVEDAVSTIVPIFNMEIPDATGEMQGMLDVATQLGEQTGGFFSIVKGLQMVNLGSLGMAFNWAITMGGFVLLIYVATSVTPVLLWIIDMILKILDAVANLIPF
jgi:hypothetical protein